MIEIAVKNENGNVWEKVARHFKEKKINILEIGVYKAAQIGEAYSHCNINSYVGVDPYLGDDSDSYRGCYWKDEAGADEIYKQSNKVFEKWGGVLERTTSEMYFRSIGKSKKFDVIFVDGDHRWLPALQDMVYWFSCLSVGGIMIVDDYASVDSPQVTRAVNCFLEAYQQYISFVDEHIEWYKNKGKHIPVCDKHIYIFKNDKIVKNEIRKKNCSKKYIWGTGKSARRCLENWGSHAMFDGVMTNDKLEKNEWNGLRYCDINEISKENSLIIVATDLYYDEIKVQLSDLGFEEGIDFVWSIFYEVFWLNGNWFE